MVALFIAKSTTTSRCGPANALHSPSSQASDDLVQLRSIPAVGTSDPLTSYIGAYRFLRHSKEMVQEGYDKVIGC
jgi:hypothetical protein